MSKQSLIDLSSATFFDNDQGLITPGSHREFNEALINYFDSACPATYIVDSDAALSAWANVAPGNDYSHVLIKTGTYNIDKTIDLSLSNTNAVIGMGGSCIISSATIGMKGSSNNLDVFLIGVNMELTAGSVVFDTCLNLIMCRGVSTSATSSSIFRNCRYLTNCLGYNRSSSGGRVYVECSYLVNCYAYIYSSTNSPVEGYNQCSYQTNCFVTASSNGGAYGFIGCNNLSNCAASVTGNIAVGFISCYKLTGCNGRGIGQSGNICFDRCRTLFGCGSYGTTSAAVFKNCYMGNSGTTNPVGDTAAGGYNW